MILCVVFLIAKNLKMASSTSNTNADSESIYQFTAKDSDGKEVSMEKYRWTQY